MPYIENRLVHDADSHLMEMSDCLNPYFEKDLLRRFLDHPNLGVRVGNRLAIEDAQKRQEDEGFRADAGKNKKEKKPKSGTYFCDKCQKEKDFVKVL